MRFHWSEAERTLGMKTGSTDQRSLFGALRITDGDLSQRPSAWSRGMQQRFVIAMALIKSPDLIVLDEPTSALDPVVVVATMDLFDTQLDNCKTAVILITHDLGLAAWRVSQLMVIHEGQIVKCATTEDILQRPQTDASKVLIAHRSWLTLPC